MRSWDYNFHSHTARCGHAQGEDEDYVLSAIKAKFKRMGFSDHIFLPGYEQPNLRGSYSELEDYLHSIEVLQSRYEGLIEIYKGFEAEYIPDFAPYYQELLHAGKVDYLIQGQHFYFRDGAMRWYSTGRDPDEAILRYTEDLIKGMSSGLFLYVAHPDFFLIFHRCWNMVSENCAKAIAEASIQYDIPLEVNMAHGRLALPQDKGEVDYPFPLFWDVVSEYGCKVVFGVDAHNPKEYETTRYELFEEFAKAHRLNLFSPSIRKK